MSMPLLLIPSQLCTRDVWRDQIEALGTLTDVTVARHRPGRSVTSMAAGILARAPARFALAAHGMGGFLAFEAWRQAPHRIDRLALLDTNATADTPAQTTRRQRYSDLVNRGEFAGVIEERIPLLFHPDRQRDPVLLARARAMAAETGAEGFLRQQQAIITRPDSRPTLPTITCPTLVIRGSHDRITSAEDAMLIRNGIPGAMLEMVEDSGHLVPLEQPEALTELMRAWLCAAGPRRAARRPRPWPAPIRSA
jgi:pimeloyl-ACP methyl ester carboxylesterase